MRQQWHTGLGTTWKNLAVGVAIVLLATAPAFAQVTTGVISGLVKDSQGGVIPGATVTLIDEAQATKSQPVVTNPTGDFVFPNVPPATYTLQVEMPSFKTLQRKGVVVTPGERVAIGTLTIEPGGRTETIQVVAEAPTIQAASGERSFVIETKSVQELPTQTRGFLDLVGLAPGVNNLSRFNGDIRAAGMPTLAQSGNGSSNFTIDGTVATDTAGNGPLMQVTIDSVAEIKVLASNFQAEYGRTGGMQVAAVTKSGTNQFRGTVYDVERNSDWNSTPQVNQLLGQPKPQLRERDWGYSIGGPVGRPGGTNQLFFFYNQEYAPRKSGGDTVQLRLPTALEKTGDFSQSLDNNGRPIAGIRDPLTGQAFANSRIPPERLYSAGQSILNLWQCPTALMSTSDQAAAGVGYNCVYQRPVENALATQPTVKADYRPTEKLRGSFKWTSFLQRNQTFNGTLPGFTDARQANPRIYTIAATLDYTLTPSTFLSSTWGTSRADLTGCALAQTSTGPTFCTGAMAMAPNSNRRAAGLDGLPTIFPESSFAIDPSYYAYQQMQQVSPPWFVDVNGTKMALLTPNFTWGSLISPAPPNVPFPGFINFNVTHDFSLSITKVAGHHTLKSGYYEIHRTKAQNASQPSSPLFGSINFGNGGNNPIDAGFGFANALLGVFQTYNQLSRYGEGTWFDKTREFYVQDNWKVGSKLTLDYGLRFTHQSPTYELSQQESNFVPTSWAPSQAPTLYQPVCRVAVAPGTNCSAANLTALNPVTNQIVLGPNGSSAALLIGTIVGGTGNLTNGVIPVQGGGIAQTGYVYPTLRAMPRFGLAYDVSGNQRFVIRGGAGLFYDRGLTNNIYSLAGNTPLQQNVTVQFASLNSADGLPHLGGAALQPIGTPNAFGHTYHAPYPGSLQWNGGVQMVLPWASTLDVSYVGQYLWDEDVTGAINNVDFGADYLPQNADPTKLTNSQPNALAQAAANALTDNLLRSYRGFGPISLYAVSRTGNYHSLQMNFSRRFTKGLSFGFADTIGLASRVPSALRYQHDPVTGQAILRADQGQADALLNPDPIRQTLRANFVWGLPSLTAQGSAMRVAAAVLNDWQLSGVWQGTSGAPYALTGAFNTAIAGAPNFNSVFTGSSAFAPRLLLVSGASPGSGCSSNVYQQFNPGAFTIPSPGSVGLENGGSPNILKGCFQSQLDLAISRLIRLPNSRSIQFRVDVFNAPNSAIVTGRVTSMQVGTAANLVDPTIANLPYSASGALIPSKSLPNAQAGLGVANAYQSPRTVQLQIRFAF
jgi:hypothetical protein